MSFKSSMLTLGFLFSITAQAAYDDSWYQDDFWSGEYGNGIAVYKENVSVPARPVMDRDIPASISCQLPFKAVFHPWNEARVVQYRTASKIIPLHAKEDFDYDTDNGIIFAKKGDLLEYLIYYSEGMFALRFKGVEYVVAQDILEKTDYDPSMYVPQEEWFKTTCVNGGEVWIFLSDLNSVDQNGDVVYFPGMGSWWPGYVEYGKVEDLTDEDLKGI
ncbi:hypothetical protein AZI86_03100 [Bdellovibrio bacteriovorus]|uniref:Uncharacterized protein n=1 Tax=Bdellovibrio bacteriovorus TaxID=959 RepID=A0A150WNU3_BDEBC|nr:hypothetical protein [Bdellovibrio bacteriovorus]KYG66068.1 hypothetical protein AZI86_03100 [Bdellovibrio bacteriovorus]